MVLIQEIEDEPEEVVPVLPEVPMLPKRSASGRSEASEKSGDESEKAAREMYTPEEEKQMIEYLHQFTRSKEHPEMVEKFIGVPPTSYKFWKGFIEATGSTRAPHSLVTKYQRLIPKLHLMPFSTEFKMDIFYSLTIPLPLDYIREVQGEVNFCMDELNHLEAFEMIRQLQQPKKTPKKGRRSSIAVKKDSKTPKKVARTSVIGSVSGSAKRPKTLYSEAENVLIWNFLLNKITDPETKAVVRDESFKPKSVFVWREYLGEKGGDAAEVKRYTTHYESMKKNLHKMPFDDQRKLDLYYGLRIPMNAEYLETLRQVSKIETDENGCLLKQESFSARTRLY
ncbi:hypothetical protein CAEBREN_10143 [Caenorhabditis brenneri]|uniref:SPK domain-containing protein n=1 Tax=Caenorhabditis brenneri TaxID=135651 RepID=G0NIZ7_CAEBE|nr:hypothetical protein CAEBREN_10143 [Caenorhabditis brenneri]